MLALLGLPSASSIAKDIISAAFSSAISLISSEVQLLLGALFSFIASTTNPVFTSGWWTTTGASLWVEVLAVAGSIMVVALGVAALEGMKSGTAEPIARALAAIPVAIVKTAALVSVVSLLVSGTDQLANYFDGSILSTNGAAVAASMSVAITECGFIGIILAAVLVLAVLGLWAELVVRAAALYLVVMMAPMVLAAAIHPRLRQSWTKLAEIIAGIILAKVIVALALAIAFSELNGLASSPTFAQALGALVAGIATIAISCFAPFVLFRLFSLEVAHLQGLARQPGRAARDAQQMAYYNRQGGLGKFLGRFGSGGGDPGGSPSSDRRPGGPGSGGGGRGVFAAEEAASAEPVAAAARIAGSGAPGGAGAMAGPVGAAAVAGAGVATRAARGATSTVDHLSGHDRGAHESAPSPDDSHGSSAGGATAGRTQPGPGAGTGEAADPAASKNGHSPGGPGRDHRDTAPGAMRSGQRTADTPPPTARRGSGTPPRTASPEPGEQHPTGPARTTPAPTSARDAARHSPAVAVPGKPSLSRDASSKKPGPRAPGPSPVSRDTGATPAPIRPISEVTSDE